MIQYIWFFIYFIKIFTFTSADTECPYVSNFEDRRINKDNIRIVQYNAEWLFIDHYSGFDCPGSQCTWKNITEAETHMTYFSKIVNDLNPDIINICEVEGCDELNILTDLLDGTYKPYLKKGTDTSTGQNVGMLTRIDPLKYLYRTENKYSYPIQNSECGYNGTSGMSGVSKHYITEFTLNNLNVAFISAHLLAIPDDPYRCSQREAQASVLQGVIADFINKGYEVIMLGDFDGDVLDVNNNVPISKVLKILKGSYGEKKGNYTLYSVAENISREERYTDWWDSDNNCDTSSIKDYSMIDHILVTSEIKKYIKKAFIYHVYPEYCGKYDSDHFPVVIDLGL